MFAGKKKRWTLSSFHEFYHNRSHHATFYPRSQDWRQLPLWPTLVVVGERAGLAALYPSAGFGEWRTGSCFWCRVTWLASYRVQRLVSKPGYLHGVKRTLRVAGQDEKLEPCLVGDKPVAGEPGPVQLQVAIYIRLLYFNLVGIMMEIRRMLHRRNKYEQARISPPPFCRDTSSAGRFACCLKPATCC